MAFEVTAEVCLAGCLGGSAVPSNRHCCPTAQLMGAEPSFYTRVWSWWVQETGETLCSVSLWTWLVMDDPDPAGGVTPALTLLWELTPLTRDDWDPIPVADLLRLQPVYSCSALFWHFQGPCSCWMWLLSVLLPRTLLCLLTSLCLTAPIPAWLTAHCPVQLTQTGLDVSSCLIKHLFSTISISQAPVLCPETSGVVSGSASPQQPICTILGMISPCCPHGTRWTQQQLLGCFLPAFQAGNMTARTAAFWRVKQKHKEQGLCATKNAAQGRKVRMSLFWGSTAPHSHQSFLLTEAFSTPSVLSVYVHLLPN